MRKRAALVFLAASMLLGCGNKDISPSDAGAIPSSEAGYDAKSSDLLPDKTVPVEVTKGILVELNINGGKITELRSEVVGGYPDIGLQHESFRAEVFSSAGELLKRWGIWDPRIELGSEASYTDNVDFTIIFPFYDNLKTFTIKDVKTGENLISVDLTNTLENYCGKNLYNIPECKTIDLNNNGIKDYKEKI